MHVWSLIKLTPERHLSTTRSAVTNHLLEIEYLTDRELIAAGLKFLHMRDRLERRSRSLSKVNVRKAVSVVKLTHGLKNGAVASQPAPSHASPPREPSSDTLLSSSAFRGDFSDMKFLERMG
jgi:hypothetical protein